MPRDSIWTPARTALLLKLHGQRRANGFGRGQPFIEDIAREMGLTYAQVQGKLNTLSQTQNHQKPQAEIVPKDRRCLRCGHEFKSRGPENRICSGCTRPAESTPLDVYEGGVSRHVGAHRGAA